MQLIGNRLSTSNGLYRRVMTTLGDHARAPSGVLPLPTSVAVTVPTVLDINGYSDQR